MTDSAQDPIKRSSARQPFGDVIEVEFEARPIRGSGQNVSAAGVYFIAEDEIKVNVLLGDVEVPGTLVRVENHGEGRTGFAVRFDQGAFDASSP